MLHCGNERRPSLPWSGARRYDGSNEIPEGIVLINGSNLAVGNQEARIVEHEDLR